MQTAPIEFLKARWGWRWGFLTAAVLILAGTALYAWMRPELYRSETRIIVMPETVFDRELSTAEAKDGIENQIQNMQQMLESRTVLQQIVEEFRLRSSDTSVPMEDALKGMRDNLEILKTSGNTFAMAYYASSPQAAQAITKRLAQIVVDRNQQSQENTAREKYMFLSEELDKVEHELAAKDEGIAQIRTSHSGEPRGFPEQQAMLREQARLQRQADEIDRMRFSAGMALNVIGDKRSDRLRILDEASLPERPEFPARHHILWIGIVLALIAALPAAFEQKKAQRDSA